MHMKCQHLFEAKEYIISVSAKKRIPFLRTGLYGKSSNQEPEVMNSANDDIMNNIKRMKPATLASSLSSTVLSSRVRKEVK